MELLLALLMVSMRESFVCSLPVADNGLFTAPNTFADLGCRAKQKANKTTVKVNSKETNL